MERHARHRLPALLAALVAAGSLGLGACGEDAAQKTGEVPVDDQEPPGGPGGGSAEETDTGDADDDDSAPAGGSMSGDEGTGDGEGRQDDPDGQ